MIFSTHVIVHIHRVSDNDGRLQLKKKFNVRHKSGRCLVKSTFCPIMSFREGACIGKLFKRIVVIDSLKSIKSKSSSKIFLKFLRIHFFLSFILSLIDKYCRIVNFVLISLQCHTFYNVFEFVSLVVLCLTYKSVVFRSIFFNPSI